MRWDAAWRRDDAPGARPHTWRHWLVDQMPRRLVVHLATKQVARYSAAIGHSLEYAFEWDDDEPRRSCEHQEESK